jgi:hypothetical protein
MTCVSRFKCSELVRDYPPPPIVRRMGNASLRGVFPGYDPKFLGLV